MPDDEPVVDLIASAVDSVVERIKASIASTGLQTGDRLPPERQLAREMGVSRNTIREALGALAQMRVIEIRRGSGTFIRDLTPSSLLDSMTFMIEISPVATLLDLLTLRRVVEAEAASLACVRMTDENLTELEACLHAMSRTSEPSRENAERDAALDLRFHEIINESAGNPALSALGAALNSTTFRLRISGGLYRASSYSSNAQSDHAAIFGAIRDRDPGRAAAAAAAHVGQVERSLREESGRGGG